MRRVNPYPPGLAGAALGLAVWLWSGLAVAESLRCGGSLVMRGDFAAEVISQCGEPDFVDAWQQSVISPGRVIPNVEQWYYNFGSSQLIQILEFRDGVLERIDSGQYGFRTPGPRDCRAAELVTGLSKYRLLEMCGEPAQIENFIVLANPDRFTRPSFRPGFLVPTLREFWLYNFGPRRLLREVVLENGIVVQVDTEGRGFERAR